MSCEIKKYLIQVKFDDGDSYAQLIPWPSIIDKFGMRDCSGEEIEVYDVSEFGKVVKLEHNYGERWNYHIFVRTDNGEVEFEGESPEH